MNKKQKTILVKQTTILQKVIDRLTILLDQEAEDESTMTDALELTNLATSVGEATDIITEIVDEEQEKLDNAPENLLESEKYQTIEENKDVLEDVLMTLENINWGDDDLDSIKDELEEALNRLQEIV